MEVETEEEYEEERYEEEEVKQKAAPAKKMGGIFSLFK